MTDNHNRRPLLDSLVKSFEKVFKFPADYIVHAPGRVNIVGEHVDYSKYPVLPCALSTRFFGWAVGVKPSEVLNVSITHQDSTFPTGSFGLDEIKGFQKTREEKTFWFDYVLCGLRGAIEEYGDFPPCAIYMCGDGNVPLGSGLSSSSALVCASMLAGRLCFSKEELSDEERTILGAKAALAERYIGLNSGGMDQAISFGAKLGYVTKIDFYPSLHGEHHPLPTKTGIIVANSLQAAHKAASNAYNERVKECSTASHLLSDLLEIPQQDTMREVQVVSGKTVAELLNMSQELPPFVSEVGKVRDRAVHVFAEVLNVESAVNACENNDFESLCISVNRSGISLKENYECSSPALDQLRSALLNAGCSAARLCGAGFGGCCIGLFDTTKLHACDIISALETTYYSDKEYECFNDVCFEAVPGGPAGFFVLD
ncbi:hypothetical protein PCE1_001076 [Barthelona sp. PCE]